jgi:phosphatidate cytidylyltransferase
MRIFHDPALQFLIGGVVCVLIVATIVGQILKRQISSEKGRQTIANMNARITAWWVMCIVFGFALLTGGIGSYLLFTLLSFLALREFVTLVPTSRWDHRALFWTFFVVTPLQYLLIGMKWYGMFTIMIPVYAFLFITARIVLSGATDRFLERAASIQWALMTCVYCLSYAPALLTVDLPHFENQGAKLLLFLVIVVQSSDVCQYICGKLFGKHRIAPSVSPNKTWEGFIGGGLVAVLIGTAIFWSTPFGPLGAAFMASVIVVMGFIGGLVMSAIKRDKGVKDFGTMIRGHGGVLDRMDSLMFAAPVFFHFARFFFGGMNIG